MKFARNPYRKGACMRGATFFAMPAAAALFAVCTPALHAQFRASLTGTVTDPQGAVVPGAKVTLVDQQNGHKLEATSNASGFYSFNALPPDTFKLTIVMPGFTTKNITDVAIVPEQANNVDVRLALGQESATVDVRADAVQVLETSTASLSGTVTSDEIQHLPSAGRDVFQLAQLTPGAFGDGQRSAGGGTNSLPGTQGPGGSPNSGAFTTENGPQTLSNGGQYETNSIQVDGISTVSAVWGGTTVITPNEDSIDNLKVTSNGYDAEFGRFSGANMQVTTKSGTNTVHGSFFFRAARPGLNAFNRYNGPSSLLPAPLDPGQADTNVNRAAKRGLVRDTARYNDFGGSIGGPVLRQRLFAFFAYETFRSRTTTPTNEWFETPAFVASAPGGYISNRISNFTGHSPVNATMIGSTCAIAGLAVGTYCQNVAGGIDIGSPLKTAKGTQDPTYVSATAPGYGGGLDGVADLAQYQVSTPDAQVTTQYNGRLDGDVTKKDHLTFTIYWVPLSHQFINGAARGYNQWNHNQVNDAFSVIYNHVFSSSLLNEARANAAGWRWNELTDNPQEPFGLPTDSINNIGGNTTIQPFGASGPSHLNQWTYGYKDVATKVFRTHTIKFGGDATQLHYLQDPLYAARPSFNFYNVWNYLNDAPYNEGGTFNRFTGVPFSNRFDQREWIVGGFAQDDWKATPNLTITYGLRYNHFGALYSKQGNQPHVNFGSGSSTFTGITLTRGGDGWQPDSANVGPQFGFAYNPNFFSKRTVIHGGYGLNYNQEEIAISANISFNPNDAVSPSFNSTPLVADPRIQYGTASNPNSLFGYAANPNLITSYSPTTGLPTTGSYNLIGLPNHLRSQQVHHYSLDMQTDLGHKLVATVGYTGSSAKHLIFHQNLYLYGEHQGYAPNPVSSFIEYYGDTGGSNYNALLLDLKHNMAHNFMLDASFTYSKSLDDNSGPYNIDPYTYNPIYNRGRSDFNFGKAFKLYGLYTPKLYYGSNKLMQVVANGFNLSGIFNIHSGFPWTPTVNYGTNAYYTGSGIGTLRPTSYNGLGGKDRSNAAFESGTTFSKNFAAGPSTYFGQYTQAQLASTTFPAPIAFYPVPGIQRNAFDGPRYSAVDATVTKSFGVPNRYLGERTGIEFRVDSFNLFNKTNLSPSINSDINNTQFGISSGGLAGRQVQMQARLSF